jgi:hypothetical protein
MDPARLKIIEDNPIEGGLDVFRISFNKICPDRTPKGLESLKEDDLQELTLDLLSAL